MKIISLKKIVSTRNIAECYWGHLRKAKERAHLLKYCLDIIESEEVCTDILEEEKYFMKLYLDVKFLEVGVTPQK